MADTPDSPKPSSLFRSILRRFRFSLRTLLLVSLLVGSVWLLIPVLPAWRMEYAIDVSSTTAKSDFSTTVNGTRVKAANGRHYCFYRSRRSNFDFDFYAFYVDNDSSNSPGGVSIQEKFSPDLKRLLITDAFHARMYDFGAQCLVWETMLPFAKNAVIYNSFSIPIIAFSKDGSRAVVLEEYRVIVLDAATGSVLVSYEDKTRETVYGAQFSDDNASLLITRRTCVSLLDLKTRKQRFISLDSVPNIDAARCKLVEGEANTLAAYSTKNGAMLLDTVTGAIKKGPWHDKNYSFEYFSDDGRYYFASTLPSKNEEFRWRSDTRNTISVFDSKSGQLLVTSATANMHVVLGGDMVEHIPKASIQGNLLAITSSNGTSKIKMIDSNKETSFNNIPQIAMMPPEHETDIGISIHCRFIPSYANHLLSLNCDELYVEKAPDFSRTENRVTRSSIYHRNHSEEWRGYFVLGELWFTVTVSALLIWSLSRDWRELARR